MGSDPSDFSNPSTPPPLPDAAASEPPVATVPYAQTVPLGYASRSYLPYESAVPRSRALVRWLWLAAAAHVLVLWPEIVVLRDRVAVARGEEIGDPFGTLKLTAAVHLIAAVPMLVSLVLWLMWVHRTHRNLPALGAEGLRFSPGWGVAYYFIPILWFFRPMQVMRETWQASDPRHPGGTTWVDILVWPTIYWWWALYLTAGASGLLSGGLEMQDGNPSALVLAASVDIFISFVNLGIIFLEVSIVRRLTYLQQSRADAVGYLGQRSW